MDHRLSPGRSMLPDLGPYPRRLTERVYLLGNPLFSIYLVVGDESSVLIEAGLSATAGQVVDQLKELGVALESVERLLICHAHADHAAGAPVLKSLLPRLEVLASPATAGLLDREKIQRAFLEDDKNESAALIKLGGVEPPVPEPVSLAGAVDGTIEPGRTIDLGGVSLEVIDAPGHALGGLVFLEPGERLVFCSDSLGFFLPPDRFVANFYVDFDDYLDTFDKLVGLDPLWLCPGHSGVYSGAEVGRFIAASRAEIEWVFDRVEEAVPWNEVPEELVESIFERHYVGPCRMFTPETIRYCSQLLVRRAAESRRLTGAASRK